jgi:asparaginyl-tRNA synthetase
MFACSLGQVYTFGPTFRAEKSHTSRHLAEFWMVEPEVVGYDLPKICELAEEMVKHTIEATLIDSAAEYSVLHANTANLSSIITKPWPRVPYEDAVKLLPGAVLGEGLSSDQEKSLTVRPMQKQFQSPVFVTHFPGAITPFYMKKSGGFAHNFDLLFPDIGELIGGSERVDELQALTDAMEGLDKASLSWYSDLRKYGTVSHAGFGLGFERLLMFLSGQSNIRDVIPVPRTHKLVFS